MKTKNHLVIALIAVIAIISSVLCLNACGDKDDKNTDYTISVDMNKSVVLYVGDDVDFKQYFTVTGKNGKPVAVTNKMLDTSDVDMTKEGTFTVTLEIGNTSHTITFTVTKKEDNNINVGGSTTDNLADIFKKYTNLSKRSFAVNVARTAPSPAVSYAEYYEYSGYNILYVNDDEYGVRYTDYLGYNVGAAKHYYYWDKGDGEYDKLTEGTDDYSDKYQRMDIVYPEALGNFGFEAAGDGFAAKSPNATGKAVLGECENATWTAFTLKVADGYVSEITAATSKNYTYVYKFSKYGSVNFTLPDGDASDNDGHITIDGFDNERLQDKIIKTGSDPDPAIGLPSTGTYTALVVPIKFSNTTISNEQLKNLNIAFNGDRSSTGWESVKSYYYKSSYQKLNLSFDIAGYNMGNISYYTANKKDSYYEDCTDSDGNANGDNVLLHEVLKYYESRIDLTKYDSNGDGTIDAVYLIYSANVEYESENSIYWAYVTWDYDNTKYDGKSVFYYLFAGLDFMIESVRGGYVDEYYPEIAGLKVNASTYIHETGHLLGLDDYYDYEPNKGSNEGLGGADMMDATVGDQNVYSKIMLNWLTPDIVVNTKTVTIKSSQERGDAILIPLNFDNSFFSEYLLIDLYSAQGLNEMHSQSLYDGANYGVRIYHVSSWINNPYNDAYESFTDNNNSVSKVALIKLIEADGTTKFSNSSGDAAASDLWQAGKTFSGVFPNYKTYGKKALGFDIRIDSVSATQATITITYAA